MSTPAANTFMNRHPSADLNDELRGLILPVRDSEDRIATEIFRESKSKLHLHRCIHQGSYFLEKSNRYQLSAVRSEIG